MQAPMCATRSDADASSRAVLVATVRGRDTGASVLAHILNARAGYQVRGFAASAGWVHLAEFAQRWLSLRDKMTNPHNQDFIHFSQFHADPDDGAAQEVPDTEFRALPELIRRRIKPAWYQVFNMSKVLCGVRQVMLDAHNPSRRRAFGVMHAFDDEGGRNDEHSRPPARRPYGAARALRSLDIFLMLFPLGRVIVHLPFPEMAEPLHQPLCMCPGDSTACRSSAAAVWPDRRANMMRELSGYARRNPDRVLLTSASGDFRNLPSLSTRLASFLGEGPETTTTTGTDRDVQRVLNHWAVGMRRDGLFDAQLGEDASRALPSEACQRASSRNGGHVADSIVSWCPSFRCGNSTGVGCTACPAIPADIAWSQSGSAGDVHSAKRMKEKSRYAAHRAARSDMKRRGIRMFERLTEQAQERNRMRAEERFGPSKSGARL